VRYSSEKELCDIPPKKGCAISPRKRVVLRDNCHRKIPRAARNQCTNSAKTKIPVRKRKPSWPSVVSRAPMGKGWLGVRQTGGNVAVFPPHEPGAPSIKTTERIKHNRRNGMQKCDAPRTIRARTALKQKYLSGNPVGHRQWAALQWERTRLGFV